MAYVSPASADAQVSKLQEFLKERLPAYMLPSAFVFVDAFPLTPHGKLDRRALAERDPPTHAASSSLSANSRSTEGMQEQLSIIWKSLLGVQFVGIDDDFFELGGHSLLASRLLAQIEKEFGVRLPLTTIFQAPTINKLACQIRGRRVPSVPAGSGLYFVPRTASLLQNIWVGIGQFTNCIWIPKLLLRTPRSRR